MVSLWPRRVKWEPRADQPGGWRGSAPCTGDRAEVGSVHVGVDVDDRLHIIVADRAHLRTRRNGGQAAQDVVRRGRAWNGSLGREADRLPSRRAGMGRLLRAASESSLYCGV